MRGPILLAVLGVALVLGRTLYWSAPPAPAPTEESQATPAPEITASIPTQPVASPAEPAPSPWDLPRRTVSTAASVLYAKSHPVTPLPQPALTAMASVTEMTDTDEFGPTLRLPPEPIDISASALRTYSRDSLCNAIVAVARANELPVPFFANLIWQESSFRLGTISPAGALGIAQFMPETAGDHGLVNPFEPIHALFSAGRLLRKLNHQYGNLGLAAAAYNAGPTRVNAWLAERRGLPGETRAYVMRITGHPADRWMTGELARNPDALQQPARAPCAEVAEETKAQAKYVRVARLMLELSAATVPPPPASALAAAAAAPKPAATKLASSKPAAPKSAAPKPAAANQLAQRDRAKTNEKPKPTAVAAARPQPAARALQGMKDQGRPPASREAAQRGPAQASAPRYIAAQ